MTSCMCIRDSRRGGGQFGSLKGFASPPGKGEVARGLYFTWERAGESAYAAGVSSPAGFSLSVTVSAGELALSMVNLTSGVIN